MMVLSKNTMLSFAFAFIGYAGLAQGGGTIVSFTQSNATAYEYNFKPAVLIVQSPIKNMSTGFFMNYGIGYIPAGLMRPL